jgi:hypothetical protein
MTGYTTVLNHWLEWGLENFLSRLTWNLDPPILPPKLSRITDLSHWSQIPKRK